MARSSGGWFPALRNKLGTVATTATGTLDSRIVSGPRGYVVPGQPYTVDWDTDRSVREGYAWNPWVFRCIEFIAANERARRIVLRQEDPDTGPIMEPGQLDREQTKLLRRLNRRANEWEIAQIWRHRLIAQFLLSSRGVFVEAVRARGGGIHSVYLLDPDRVVPVPGRRKTNPQDPNELGVVTPIETFRVTTAVANGAPIWDYRPPFDPDASPEQQPSGIVWIRSPHPTIFERGMSPMEAAGLSVDLDRYARLYNRRFMTEDGRPGGIAAVKGPIEDAYAQMLENRFNGGPDVSGARTLVIEADEVSWVDTSGNPRDTQWADTMDRTKREICVAFGLPESVVSDASGQCVDDETEALTQRGWVSGDEITTDDTILSMDPADGVLKWSPVHEVYRAHYRGVMYRLKHSHADFLVTAGHNWAVETRARDCQRGVDTPYLLRKVEDLSRSDRIRAIGDAECSVTDAAYSNAFVELVGWAVTEGHYYPDAWSTEHRPTKIAQSVCLRQKAGPNIERIEACLKEAGARFVKGCDLDRPMYRFNVRGEVAAALHQVSPDRVMSLSFLFALTAEQRELLLQTMIDGDGCRQASTASWTFAQEKKAASEAFVVLATLCGYTTSMREREFTYRYKGVERQARDWIVVVRQRKVMTIQRDTRTVEHYDGKIWCPRTSYGTFVARRHGKVIVTGNTFDNADADYAKAWEHGMLPLFRLLDAQLDVLTPGGFDDDTYLAHDVSDVWVLGRYKRAREDRAAANLAIGAITVDEYREVLELDPWDVPGSRVLWIPAGRLAIADDQPAHDGDADAAGKAPMGGQPPAPAAAGSLPGGVGVPNSLPPGFGVDPSADLMGSGQDAPADPTDGSASGQRALAQSDRTAGGQLSGSETKALEGEQGRARPLTR